MPLLRRAGGDGLTGSPGDGRLARGLRLAAVLFLLGSGPALGASTLREAVAARRAYAERLARRGKLRLALQELARAGDAIAAGRRKALAARLAPPPDPRIARELARLERELQAKRREAKEPAARARAFAEFSRKRRELERRFPPRRLPPEERTRAEQAAQAPHYLMQAEVEEQAARYHERAGERDDAALARRRALEARLRAYRALRRDREAAAAADGLPRATPLDPEAYRTAAEFFQAEGRHERAAEILREAVSLIESGRARAAARIGRRTDGRRGLPVLYRQLAFCYSQLGRPGPMREALEKAQRAERERVP